MWFASIALALGVSGASGETAYVGIVSRTPALEQHARALDVSLGRWFEQAGVTVIRAQAAPTDPFPRDPQLEELVSRARAHHLEGRFDAALEDTRRAISRFESQAAYRPGPSWDDLADALVLRSLALSRLGRDKEADAALAQLASVLPDVAPDAEITPPKAQARHAALLLELKRGPRVVLEAVTEPAGADVFVDGKHVGQSPVAMQELLPGTHYVGFAHDGAWRGRRIEITEGTGQVQEPLPLAAAGNPMRVRKLLGEPVDEATLVGGAAGIGSDVIVGVVEALKSATALVLVRIRGDVVAVTGTLVAANAEGITDADGTLGPRNGDVSGTVDRDEETAVARLAHAVLTGRTGWVDDAPHVAIRAPSDIVFSPRAELESSEVNPWVWVAVTVGITAISAGIVGTVLALTPPDLKVALDASRL